MKSKRVSLSKIVTVSGCAALLALALADGQRLLRAQLVLGQPSQSTGVSYSGQATVVSLSGMHNYPVPIVICDTGPLPSSGGTLQATVLQTNVFNGALTFDTAAAFATGDGAEAKSSTTVNNFQLQIMAMDGSVSVVTADYISSEAVASCRANGNVDLEATVSIENLVINGQKINVSKQPNQVVNIPGGQIIINQQTSSVNGSSGAIACAALQIRVEGCMTGPICYSHSDIICTDTVPPPSAECGKLTGGGWIIGTPSGAKGTFAVSGGIRRGQFWGHLNYIDHGMGMHVKSTGVTGFATDPADPDCRDITYNVLIDGVPGTASVIACDKGEPGRNDVFDITLSTGYHAGGDLGGSRPGGGNIQLHKCPQGWLKR